ncbi:MAG: hypothetical protein EI684_02320 [Candidatus Viridilinea halotolerans]|uniref:MBL fold metallo-hydrolase n=1 Tax=Candidatus Viridilinea halotolerans TaxID=2491704 RepID=A0A426U9C2_9CHLR|nr:MAG: hypothetical protein EI684_02320 [Candidatus Viridilinea halotolerans]
MGIEIAFLDVGNADSIVVHLNEQDALLIDLARPRYVCEWLEKCGVLNLKSVYITHGHADHSPKLSNLHNFIKQWLNRGLELVMLPGELLNTNRKINDPNEMERLHNLLGELRDLENNSSVRFQLPRRDPRPYQYGDVAITCLHPSELERVERDQFDSEEKNEVSAVYRVDYGAFRAVLMADVNNKGIDSFLRYFHNLRTQEIHCNLIKVPHHGAWDTSLESLFDHVDPELAVLSVGSTNSYGHVRLELFAMLWRRQQDEQTRLRRFLCTEATRSCLLPVAEHREREGMKEKTPCGGDIVVIIPDASGVWQLRDEQEQRARADCWPYAACLGRLTNHQ